MVAAVVVASTVVEAAATAVAVVDTVNPGLRRKFEIPLIHEKARLLRQAGFFASRIRACSVNRTTTPGVPHPWRVFAFAPRVG